MPIVQQTAKGCLQLFILLRVFSPPIKHIQHLDCQIANFFRRVLDDR